MDEKRKRNKEMKRFSFFIIIIFYFPIEDNDNIYNNYTYSGNNFFYNEFCTLDVKDRHL